MAESVLNYTTQISVSKTVGEIQGMLMDHGAHRILLESDNGQPCAISFQIQTEHGDRMFTLPVNVDRMHKLLVSQKRSGKLRSLSEAAANSKEQAARVAWRVVKDWLEAQLAIISAGMVSIDQVMLPYMKISGELTVYESYVSEQHALEA